MTNSPASVPSAPQPEDQYDTCVIVPCFNEATRLRPEVFRKHLQASPTVGFLFVDDGSTDDTNDILTRLCDSSPGRCSTLTLGTNRGKGEAVRRGLRVALERRRNSFVGYWDADLAAPLEEIERMRSVLNRHDDIDIVMGIRLSLLGHEFRQGLPRKMFGRIFAATVSLLLRCRFRDTQCGAKLFRATPALRRATEETFMSRWIFDIELVLRCEVGGSAQDRRCAKVYEHPLRRWNAQDQSKVTPLSYASALTELPVIAWRYRRGSRPSR